jgi:hypothetical protein
VALLPSRAVEWVDLVAPSAAILSLFAVVALIVVAIRQGRQIRRLEERLERTGDAAVEAPLQRIAELQARQQVSEGGGRIAVQRHLRTLVAVGVTGLVLILAIAGVWYLFIRGDGSSTTAAGGTQGTTTQSQTAANPRKPVDATLVPDEVPAIADRSVYRVAVLNASGIQGAAGDVIAPRLQNEGWTTGPIANAPSTTDESVVMFTKGKRNVAWNVAQELGIKRAPPLDGLSAQDIGNADVVVLVGLDLANDGTAPAP